MNSLTQRYAPGGDLYAQLSGDYGANGAQRVYQAAIKAEETGERYHIADAIGELRNSSPTLNESTLSILGSQLYNDPLGAPIDAAGNVAKAATRAALGNWGVYVIVAVIVGGVILWRKV